MPRFVSRTEMFPYFQKHPERSQLKRHCCCSMVAFLPGEIQHISFLLHQGTYECFISSLEWAREPSLKAQGGDS